MQTGVLAILAAMSVLGVGAIGATGMMSSPAPSGTMGGGMMGGGGMGGMDGGMHGGGGMMGDCNMDQMQNDAMNCEMQMGQEQCHCCAGDGQ